MNSSVACKNNPYNDQKMLHLFHKSHKFFIILQKIIDAYTKLVLSLIEGALSFNVILKGNLKQHSNMILIGGDFKASFPYHITFSFHSRTGMLKRPIPTNLPYILNILHSFCFVRTEFVAFSFLFFSSTCQIINKFAEKTVVSICASERSVIFVYFCCGLGIKCYADNLDRITGYLLLKKVS